MTAAADIDFDKRYQAAIDRARAYSNTLLGPSMAERLAEVLTAGALEQIPRAELARLLYRWEFWARPKQNPRLESVTHRILFLLGGRGSGKTLSGAQRVRQRVEAGARSIAIVGPTLEEIERYQIKGEGGADGVLTVFPPAKRPHYNAHKKIIHFHRVDCTGCGDAEKCGGAIGYVNSAEKPEFRGPNIDTVWLDEPAKCRYLNTMWHNIELATRLRGRVALEIILSGTPLPLRLLREIIADEETVTVLMSQEENAANLDPRYVARMRRKYGGTRLGRQELGGELLSDNPDALFSATVLDHYRVESPPAFEEIAIAVDPAIATNPDNDDTGIIGGGRDAAGHIYVFLDASSKSKPDKWGGDVCTACDQHECDIVVAERNRGGDLVAANVRAARAAKRGPMAAKALKVVEVHATRGKAIRAEPVAALSEQGMLHIVGTMPELEGELTEWNPRIGGVSPNRLDALVWLVWYLARLGDNEERPDYKTGFTGLLEGAAALRSPAPLSASGLAAALPRSAWGSKL